MRYIDVSAGSKAEHLIATVILANIELLQKTVDEAKILLSDALAIAEKFSCKGSHYRSLHTSKFACFTYNYEGVRETLPLPVINDRLIIPAINLPEVVLNVRQSVHKTLNLEDVSIRYYRLQFHTGEMLGMLRNAVRAQSQAELATIIAGILEQSLKLERKPDNPLDVAGDYFFLARNLLSKGDVTLTRIALKKADEALAEFEEIGRTSPKYLLRIHALKSELKAISESVL